MRAIPDFSSSKMVSMCQMPEQVTFDMSRREALVHPQNSPVAIRCPERRALSSCSRRVQKAAAAIDVDADKVQCIFIEKATSGVSDVDVRASVLLHRRLTLIRSVLSFDPAAWTTACTTGERGATRERSDVRTSFGGSRMRHAVDRPPQHQQRAAAVTLSNGPARRGTLDLPAQFLEDRSRPRRRAKMIFFASAAGARMSAPVIPPAPWK